MSLNKVMLIGNVGSDPEVRYLENNPQNPGNNVKVATIRLATTERYRDRNGELRENTEWHSVVLWRNNADVAEKFVHKGSQIYIEGKLRTRQWTDQSGNKRYTTEVVADTLQLLGKRQDGDGSQAQGAYQGGYQGSYQGPSQSGYQGPSQSGYQGPSQGGYSQPQPQRPAQPAYQSPSAPQPVQGGPAPAQPASAGNPYPAQSAPQPANPAYQGPLPADEPADDLPF